MKTTFTRQEMQEAFEHGEATGRHGEKMDERNDELSLDAKKHYRQLMSSKGCFKLPSFEQWMYGRFDKD